MPKLPVHTQDVACCHHSARYLTIPISVSVLAAWMWRNRTVLALLEWLQKHNASLPKEMQRLHSVGFYGLDLYSLNAYTQAVVSYLEKIDPPAAMVAMKRSSCFDR